MLSYPARRRFGKVTGAGLTKPPQAPLAWVAGMDLRLLWVHYLVHDGRQSFSFLFRLFQPGNHRGKFIEYLVPAF